MSAAERYRKYYARHKSEIQARRKRYYAEHTAKFQAYRKKYRQEKYEHLLEYNRHYRVKNRDEFNRKRRENYRKRKRALIGKRWLLTSKMIDESMLFSDEEAAAKKAQNL